MFDSAPGKISGKYSITFADAISFRRALVAIFEMYHRAPATATYTQHTQALFAEILRLSDSAKPPFKETLLITVGILGKYVPFFLVVYLPSRAIPPRTTNMDTLCKVVCCLVSQLGQANPVLKGVSYMQVRYINGITNDSAHHFY